MVPMALPLAILLASLMTFGNLGERFELTAIKASGISVKQRPHLHLGERKHIILEKESSYSHQCDKHDQRAHSFHK